MYWTCECDTLENTFINKKIQNVIFILKYFFYLNKFNEISIINKYLLSIKKKYIYFTLCNSIQAIILILNVNIKQSFKIITSYNTVFKKCEAYINLNLIYISN